MSERINFIYQEKMVKSGYDINHILILDWFYWFHKYGKMKSIVRDGKEFYWIKYHKILSDQLAMPCRNERTIKQKIHEMIEGNIFERTKTAKSVYIRPGKLYYTYVFDSSSTVVNGCSSTVPISNMTAVQL